MIFFSIKIMKSDLQEDHQNQLLQEGGIKKIENNVKQGTLYCNVALCAAPYYVNY